MTNAATGRAAVQRRKARTDQVLFQMHKVTAYNIHCAKHTCEICRWTVCCYSGVVRHYAAKIGLKPPGFCPHSLRATAATNSLDNGADIAKVEEWLGHANIATTRLYDLHKSERISVKQARHPSVLAGGQLFSALLRDVLDELHSLQFYRRMELEPNMEGANPATIEADIDIHGYSVYRIDDFFEKSK